MKHFSPPEWVQNAIFYQIFIDRFANGNSANDPPGVVPWETSPTRENYFGGDLQGILDHLSYLQNLGVTALYLTPIFKAHTNHKYDTNDYLMIDPSFGTIQLLSKLVEEAHSRGIRVVLDAVFNHCGDGFFAFEDVKKNGALSRYASWFFIDHFPINQNPPSYQTCGGVWYLPKLNTTNPEVKEYLINTAKFWIETCGIDGWRLDVPWKVSVDFWRLFREQIKQVKSDLYIVGEAWRDSQHWLQGDTFDGVMNYALRSYILDYCVYDTMDAEDFDYEINLLRRAQGRFAGCQLNLLGSHDTPRLLTLCHESMARFILAITFQFTYIGAPMIYYGDEVGLKGGNDPDCRKCMPWDISMWEPELVHVYNRLIHARHSHPALWCGDFQSLFVFNGVYSYMRCFNDDTVIVILNPREERQHVRIPLSNINVMENTWSDLLSNSSYKVRDAHLQIETLPSKKALVLTPFNRKLKLEIK